MKTLICVMRAGFLLWLVGGASAWSSTGAVTGDSSKASAPTSIPLSQLGERADQQQKPSRPRLENGEATLVAPLQALRGRVGRLGMTIESTSASEGIGRFSLVPIHVGRGEPLLELRPGKVSTRDQSVILDRGQVEEIFTASADGIRQDFVIKERPEGSGSLTLSLEVRGAEVRQNGENVSLKLPGGRRELVYHGLKVTDAGGKVLDARLVRRDRHALAIAVQDGQAQYPLTIDPTISDADWLVWSPGLPGADQRILAMAISSDGSKLYVGGDGFGMVGNAAAKYVAQWDGSGWSRLGTGVNGGVHALAVAKDGTVYAGGYFTQAGGQPANRIAKWNGSAWSPLGDGVDNGVFALAVASDGTVYAGGYFTQAGGQPANRIALWNGTAWFPLGEGMNDGVRALAASGTSVYAGGMFSTAGDVSANRVAKWDGTAWSSLGSGIEEAGFYGGPHVLALAASGDNLYAAGYFMKAGGQPAQSIARWDGSNWSPLGSGFGQYGSVSALVASGGTVYAGGSISNAGGVQTYGIAKWSNGSWSGLGGGVSKVSGSSYVSALIVDGDTVYAGGEFDRAGGSVAKNIARWDGSAWSKLGREGFDGWVADILVSGNDVYVAGDFTAIGNLPARYIARWNGSVWSLLGSGLNGPARSLAISGNTLYVGGLFGAAFNSGDSYVWDTRYIARWDGSQWSSLGSGMNSYVFSLAVSGDTLYAGGYFTSAGGVAANYVAQWKGSSWSALGSGANGFVFALAPSDDGALYVGGDFTSAGGVPGTGYMGRWQGGSWSPLGTGMSGGVRSLLLAGNKLYAGGLFTSAGGVSNTRYIAAWNGTAWTALGSGVSAYVFDMASFDGSLYAGGDFIYAGGVNANRVARWDGSAWSALGSGAENRVQAVAAAGGKLLVGGNFFAAGGKVSPYAAYVNLPSTSCGDGISLPSGAGAQWQMLSLPCEPGATPADVKGVFGTGTLSNLDTARYGVANPQSSTGWIIERRNPLTGAYEILGKDEPLTSGTGYWIKSYQSPADGKLKVAGTATPTDVTQAQGCSSANGCKAVAVSTLVGSNRYNLVGNPFAYPVEWAQVRVRAGDTVYTPSQAETAGILSKQIWIWNGTSYDTFDDSVQPGNLQYFKSFWVNVLPGAFGKKVELLIPAHASPLSQTIPVSDGTALPWYLSWLDLLASPARADEMTAIQARTPVNWQVRLKVDNHATGWHDHTNLLGQWQDAQPEQDARDLVEMAPFDKPYLTLVFPHAEWGPKAGDYATDFRPSLGNPRQEWIFELRANPLGGVVFISWEGDAKVLRRSRLIDIQTGKVIRPSATKWARKGLPVILKSPVQRYVWRYLGR